MTLSATATDNKGVVGVRFRVVGPQPAALRTPCHHADYSVSWDTTTVPNGSYTLTAVARDAAGNTTTSTPVTVNVDKTTAPTVSVTPPAGGATVSGTVTLSATASDNVGVEGVRFRVRRQPDSLDADATTADYSVSWDTTTVPNGSYTLTALARDAAGNTTTSAPVTVTVANADTFTTPIAVGSAPSTVVVSGTKVYVLNAGDHTVSVIDSNTKEVIGNPIPVAYWSDNMVATPDGTSVYVIATDNYVQLIDTNTNTVTASILIPVQNDCGDCWFYVSGAAVSRDSSRLYVTANDGSLSVIDTATNTVISTTNIADDLDNYYSSAEVSADGRVLYATSNTGGTIAVIDTATLAVVQKITPGSPVFELAISPDGKRMYVTGWYGVVSVIDTDPQSGTYNTRIATITVPDSDPSYSGSWDVAFGPDGSNRAYVTQADGMTVSVINTNTMTAIGSVVTDPTSARETQPIVVAPNGTLYVADGADGKVYAVTVGNLSSADQTTITVGTSPVAVVVRGPQAYVANYNDNTVSVIDTNTNNVIKTLTVGASPRNLAASPDGTRVYVANLYDNTVSVIDTNANTVVDTIEIDDIPPRLARVGCGSQPR